MAKDVEKKVILVTYGQESETSETPMQRAFREAQEKAEQKKK